MTVDVTMSKCALWPHAELLVMLSSGAGHRQTVLHPNSFPTGTCYRTHTCLQGGSAAARHTRPAAHTSVLTGQPSPAHSSSSSTTCFATFFPRHPWSPRVLRRGPRVSDTSHCSRTAPRPPSLTFRARAVRITHTPI